MSPWRKYTVNVIRKVLSSLTFLPRERKASLIKLRWSFHVLIASLCTLRSLGTCWCSTSSGFVKYKVTEIEEVFMMSFQWILGSSEDSVRRLLICLHYNTVWTDGQWAPCLGCWRQCNADKSNFFSLHMTLIRGANYLMLSKGVEGWKQTSPDACSTAMTAKIKIMAWSSLDTYMYMYMYVHAFDRTRLTIRHEWKIHCSIEKWTRKTNTCAVWLRFKIEESSLL